MKNLNLNCAIGETGYGVTSLNILKELSKLDINISLFPMGTSYSVNSEEEKSIINKLANNATNFDYNAPALKIWHQFDLASRPGNGKYFAFPFFEVDTLTTVEQHHLNFVDCIFVASSWAKDILIKNQVHKPIIVCPLGVDLEIFQTPPKIRPQSNVYSFFHIGKWEKRKSQDFLIEAFNNAFDTTDDVELRLLPKNPFLSEEQEKTWLSLATNCKLASKIKIFDRLPTQYHLAEFIFYSDCAVFLSRGEGWNNEIIECMAMNKPVIATDYSAHTEYCTKDNSSLVSIENIEPAKDGVWFFGVGNWAKLGMNEMEQTVEHMRNMYKNRVTTNEAGIKTATEYSWKRTAQTIYKTIYLSSVSKATERSKRRKKIR